MILFIILILVPKLSVVLNPTSKLLDHMRAEWDEEDWQALSTERHMGQLSEKKEYITTNNTIYLWW